MSLLFGKESEHNLIRFLEKTTHSTHSNTSSGLWANKITKAREHILQFLGMLCPPTDDTYRFIAHCNVYHKRHAMPCHAMLLCCSHP
jgi:hypothetical protein